MGQQVNAIVYGVYKTDAHRPLFGDDGDWSALPPSALGRIEQGDGRRQVIGFAVAVANCYEGDEVDFPECPVSQVSSTLELLRWKARWLDLAKWARERGVVLGVPELLLVPVERA